MFEKNLYLMFENITLTLIYFVMVLLSISSKSQFEIGLHE